MRVLDLFAGLGGWSSAFTDDDVVSLDLDPRFGTTIVADVLELDAGALGGAGAFDLVLASPPCEGFSVASIGRYWRLEGRRGSRAIPTHPRSVLGTRIALHTLELCRALEPRYGFVIENPTGMMRHVLDGRVRRWRHPDTTSDKAPSVTYCTLGLPYRKPTDLWLEGPLLAALRLPAPCDTGRDETATVYLDGREFRVNRRTGVPCHEVARRGAKTGVQGLDNSADRALVPAALSSAVRDAAIASETYAGDLAGELFGYAW